MAQAKSPDAPTEVPVEAAAAETQPAAPEGGEKTVVSNVWAPPGPSRKPPCCRPRSSRCATPSLSCSSSRPRSPARRRSSRSTARGHRVRSHHHLYAA
jgi:hypothetical protein